MLPTLALLWGKPSSYR